MAVSLVVTDLCLLRPDPATQKLVVVSIRAGVARAAIAERTGWPVRFAAEVAETPPVADELATLRDLKARTARAHGAGATA